MCHVTKAAGAGSTPEAGIALTGAESCGVWRELPLQGRGAGVPCSVRPRPGAGQRPFKLRSSLWGSWEAGSSRWRLAAVAGAGHQWVKTRLVVAKDGPKN